MKFKFSKRKSDIKNFILRQIKRFIGQKVKSISVIWNTDMARVTTSLGPYCEKWTVLEKRQYSNWTVSHTQSENR